MSKVLTIRQLLSIHLSRVTKFRRERPRSSCLDAGMVEQLLKEDYAFEWLTAMANGSTSRT